MKVLTFIKSNNLTAGPKAERDIISIIKDNYKNVKNDIVFNNGKYNKINKLLLILKNLFVNDWIIIQYPIMANGLFKLLPNKKSIILIHDLNSLRNPNDVSIKNEYGNLKHFNYIICHNDKMKQYLIDRGIEEYKLYTNDLFDYLCNTRVNNSDNTFNGNIVYAGNMAKSPFINQLKDEKLRYSINLYGQGIDSDVSDKVLYKGKFQPEDLPIEWSGSVGLVWDGNIDESDENKGFKNYTKYNNPHKLSCYIAAGIPVIVWRKSAVSEFVLKNNIGYVISNIYDINELDFSDYSEKKKNVDLISKRVKEGYYTKKVIDKIINGK